MLLTKYLSKNHFPNSKLCVIRCDWYDSNGFHFFE